MPRPEMVALGRKLDALNEQIAQIEAHLKEMFNVTASVRVFDENGPLDVALGFGKLANKWQLFLMMPDGARLPLNNGPRQYRLAAVGVLDHLVAALEDEERLQDVKVTAASSAADAFLRHVAKRNKESP